jgi:thiamine pyrophosphate-dependent acetolactate synthase large subunit-like protein
VYFQGSCVDFIQHCDQDLVSWLSDMYTTSSVFLQTLSEAGITHAFVNWGSDHPGLLEDLERQRTDSENHATRGDHDTTNPTIITCPNEMVALSAAQGYAQVTGNPAAVIVHVDVGTQVSLKFFFSC